MTALRAGLPMELEWIVGKALAKDADERYQYVEETVVDLRVLNKKSKKSASAPGTAPGTIGSGRVVAHRPSGETRRVLPTLTRGSAASLRYERFLGNSTRKPPRWPRGRVIGLAIIHAGLGEKDQALAWLNRAGDERYLYLPTWHRAPVFDDLRSDPRSQQVRKKMGLE